MINEINIPPSRELGKSHRKVIMKGYHDTPVYLHPEINAKVLLRVDSLKRIAMNVAYCYGFAYFCDEIKNISHLYTLMYQNKKRIP